MTKLTKRSALATGVLLGALALTAHAQPGERMFERMSKKLDLTAEQQASVREIRAEYGGNREEALAKRAEIKALVDSGEVDAAAELAATHAREAVYRRAEMRNALSQVLTPEQLAEMEALTEQRMEQGRRGRQRGGRDNTTGF